MANKASPLASIPHSWDLESWEEKAGGIWPYNKERARRIVRRYKPELQAAGALSRVGRTLVILGNGYQRWLESNAARVSNYDVPMNRPEHADKRFGNGTQRKKGRDQKPA